MSKPKKNMPGGPVYTIEIKNDQIFKVELNSDCRVSSGICQKAILSQLTHFESPGELYDDVIPAPPDVTLCILMTSLQMAGLFTVHVSIFLSAFIG